MLLFLRVGNGYNIDDGSFIAPVDGIYQFSSTMMTNGLTSASMEEVWPSSMPMGRRGAMTKALTLSSYSLIREIASVW